ncbi:hypothetical protein EDB89DRAFT_1910238 [Lactarius sanguifluus]|nr:hypothetical protein EDB89DRAFT_1910238 [Lactarius sanguifluus]
MSNPSKSFYTAMTSKQDKFRKSRKSDKSNTTVRCSRGGVAGVGGRGVLSIMCSAVAVGWRLRVGRRAGVWQWVGGCGVGHRTEVVVSCAVLWRHGDGVGGFARWVGCGVMAKWHGWGGDERKKKNNKNQKTHSKRVEQEAEAELVVILHVATAWWGGIWSSHGGVVVVENLLGKVRVGLFIRMEQIGGREETNHERLREPIARMCHLNVRLSDNVCI